MSIRVEINELENRKPTEKIKPLMLVSYSEVNQCNSLTNRKFQFMISKTKKQLSMGHSSRELLQPDKGHLGQTFS